MAFNHMPQETGNAKVFSEEEDGESHKIAEQVISEKQENEDCIEEKYKTATSFHQIKRPKLSWKYMILVSAFFIQVLTFGTVMSIGVYTIEFLDYFQSNSVTTSLVGSVNIGIFLGAGPLVSLLLRKLSYRIVGLLGSLIGCSGLLALQIANDIKVVIVVYGIFTGLGFSLICVSANIITGLYFNKNRSLATGIVSCGIGVGGTVFPSLSQLLIDKYGWRGSVLIITGVCLNLLFFSALLRNPYCNSGSLNKIRSKCEHTEENAPSNKKENKSILAIFHNSTFITYLINNVLWNTGGSMITVFGPDYFTEVALSKTEAAFAMTLYNLFQVFGGVFGGFVGNINYVDRNILYTVSSIIKGLITFLLCVTTFQSVSGIYTIMSLLGFSYSILLALLVVITTDILGVDLLGEGFGFIMLCNGFGAMIGPPIGGWLRDTLKTYEPTLYLSGALTVFSGLVFSVVILKKHCQKK